MSKFLILGSNSVSAGYLIKLLLKNKKNKLICFSRNKQYHQTLTPYNKKILSHLNFRFYKININKDYRKAFNIIDNFEPNGSKFFVPTLGLLKILALRLLTLNTGLNFFI